VPQFNFDTVGIQMAAVTLEYRSRSNDWYVSNVLWRDYHLPYITQDQMVITLSFNLSKEGVLKVYFADLLITAKK